MIDEFTSVFSIRFYIQYFGGFNFILFMFNECYDIIFCACYAGYHITDVCNNNELGLLDIEFEYNEYGELEIWKLFGDYFDDFRVGGSCAVAELTSVNRNN